MANQFRRTSINGNKDIYRYDPSTHHTFQFPAGGTNGGIDIGIPKNHPRYPELVKLEHRKK